MNKLMILALIMVMSCCAAPDNNRDQQHVPSAPVASVSNIPGFQLVTRTEECFLYVKEEHNGFLYWSICENKYNHQTSTSLYFVKP